MLQRFGPAAVFGSSGATRAELRAIDIAAKVDAAYKSRAASKDWPEWYAKNPAEAELLTAAMECHRSYYA